MLKIKNIIYRNSIRYTDNLNNFIKSIIKYFFLFINFKLTAEINERKDRIFIEPTAVKKLDFNKT